MTKTMTIAIIKLEFVEITFHNIFPCIATRVTWRVACHASRHRPGTRRTRKPLRLNNMSVARQDLGYCQENIVGI